MFNATKTREKRPRTEFVATSPHVSWRLRIISNTSLLFKERLIILCSKVEKHNAPKLQQTRQKSYFCLQINRDVTVFDP